MKWRTERTGAGPLVLLAVISVGALALAERSTVLERQPFYAAKVQAAEKARLAQHVIKEERIRLGRSIDPVNDPNETGMIGQEFTLVTTDRGDIRSKLIATNPDFAAAVVEMLERAGLKRGDFVAVGVTGSFPALNIAALAALETLDLRPIVITSVGASSWGATDPDFTWLDMETRLASKGIFKTRSVAASIGGGKDFGRGLSVKGRELLREAIRRNHVRLIEEKTLEDSIAARMKIYDQRSKGRPIRAYINIGGGVASLGSKINGRLVPPGLSKNLARKNFPNRGTMILMGERGIPVINLLDIRAIAQRYGLPVAPEAISPAAGQGSIYFKARYDRSHLLLLTLALLILTIAVVRVDLKHYLFRLPNHVPGAGGSSIPPLEDK